MHILNKTFLRRSALAFTSAAMVAAATPASATYSYYYGDKKKYCEATYTYLSYKLKWYDQKIAYLSGRDGKSRWYYVYKSQRAMYQKYMTKWEHSCATQVSCAGDRNDDACEPVVSPKM